MGLAIYKSGTLFPYLGKEYMLEIRNYRSYQKPGVMLDETRLVVLAAQTDEALIEAAVKAWYKNQARKMIPERVEQYRCLMNETVAAIRIKDVRSRWGSCSSKRNLNFNWRLIMAPLEVLDYVVIHELCHLKEMNHSAEFWKLVERMSPEYKKHRQWLNTCRLIETY